MKAKIIQYAVGLGFGSLCLVADVSAQAKKNPLAALAAELEPQKEVVEELDTYQALDAQLDAYDVQRNQHKKEQREAEQKKQREKALATPTPNPFMAQCQELIAENKRMQQQVLKLNKVWQENDRNLKNSSRELDNFDRELLIVQRSNKELFVHSDINWFKSINDNVGRVLVTYNKDLERYKRDVTFDFSASPCNLSKGCTNDVKLSKQFIVTCQRWQAEKNKVISQTEQFSKQKYQKMLATYKSSLEQMKKLREKREHEYKIKNGKL